MFVHGPDDRSDDEPELESLNALASSRRVSSSTGVGNFHWRSSAVSRCSTGGDMTLSAPSTHPASDGDGSQSCRHAVELQQGTDRPGQRSRTSYMPR